MESIGFLPAALSDGIVPETKPVKRETPRVMAGISGEK